MRPAPRRHSGAGRNPGNGAEVVKAWRVFQDGTFGCHACIVIPAYAGMDYYNHWIPACAGMTGVVNSGLSATVSGIRQPVIMKSRACREARTTPPPSFQRRLESRKAGRGVRRIARVTPARIAHKWSFPPRREWMNQPLDSGLRRNDGGAVAENLPGMAGGL